MTEQQEQQVRKLYERAALLRSLEGKPADECRALADDTIRSCIDQAEELGLQNLQKELQHLSVYYGYPEEYKSIKRQMQEAEASCELVFKTFRVPICALLDGLDIDYDFTYRMKSVYSIWHKMHKDNKTFDEIYDLFATRIVYRPRKEEKSLEQFGLVDYRLDPSPLPVNIFDPETLECWRIYTAITSIYRVQPDRIKDWVTHPKPSGYQALQITCMGPDCNWIEVQIRSERMHNEAETGSASHWKYKQSGE